MKEVLLTPIYTMPLARSWPQAATLARTVLRDEALGQIALLKVCARITASRAAQRIQIKNLKGYIFQSYRNEILRILQARRVHDEITANEYSLPTESQQLDVHNKILIEELVSRMDETNRRVFELRVLGHSYEEISETLNIASNVLRNTFSRQLRKIKAELEGLSDES